MDFFGIERGKKPSGAADDSGGGASDIAVGAGADWGIEGGAVIGWAMESLGGRGAGEGIWGEVRRGEVKIFGGRGNRWVKARKGVGNRVGLGDFLGEG